MPDRVPVTAWMPSSEPPVCAVCEQARADLAPEGLTVAGEIAVQLVSRSRVGPLVESTVNRLAAALGPGRVSMLVPEAGGKWRVFASSDLSETHDLMVDVERYPELLEVRRTGVPFVVGDASDPRVGERLRSALGSGGVSSTAAFPVLVFTQTGDPVVLKLSLHVPLDGPRFGLATLVAHLLLHRLSRLPQAEIAHQLGLTHATLGAFDPGTLLRLLPIPAVLVDGEGRIVNSNSRAAWLLRGRGGAVSGAVEALPLEPDRPWRGHATRWEATLSGGKEPLPVLGWSNRTGADRTLVLFEPHPETRRRGDERRIRRALADKLRELAAANQMLEEHARRRSRFVSDAAHELKTPLAILRSYLETLDDDLADGLSGEQREFLRAAIHGARRLQRLIEELLDLAALEGGHLAISVGPVAASQVISAAVHELEPLAAQAGVVLATRCVDDLQVRSDPERLGQVVRNLVENGLKYTRRGGEVTVDLSRQGDRGVISVHDNGVGISPEALPRIFDEFVRGPNSQAAEGAGLGLAIVRRLVLAMGGRVWVDSSPGQGSRFFVELPLWSGDA